MRLTDENLRGRVVIAADGHAVGEVAALFVDSNGWHVESLRVKLRRDAADRLGAPRGLWRPGTIEIPVRLVQSVGDAVVLSVALDALRETLTSTHADESAPAP